jgi:uncharacterized coiled-coil protein SlyX
MPLPNTPTAARRSTLRTVVLTVILTLAVLFVLIVIAVWRSGAGYGTVSVQSRILPMPGAAEPGMAVSGKAEVSDMSLRDSAPEIMPPEPVPPPFDGSGATAEERQKIGQKIIRTGNLSLRVDDAAKRLDEAKKLAEQFGGFVASSNLADNAGVKTAYLTIRVPTDKYNDLVDAAKKLAALVLSESSNAEDVTAQFVDLNARLKAAQAEEAQYLAILKQAKTVEDTLKVTDYLSQVRSRIEQMQGQLRYLTDKTDYATLNLTLTEETRIEVPTRTWKPLETMRQSFRALILALQSLADLLIGVVIFGLGFLLPLGLLLWLIYFALRRMVRRFRK